MDVCVISAGHVGLVTAAVFADLGNDVACVDIDQGRINQLNRGAVPIFEPGLEEMVRRNLQDGRLTFTTDLAAAVRKSQVIFIAVGTPAGPGGESDLGQVEAAARGIGQALNGYKVIVNKSTVPVGTGDLVREVIERHAPPGIEFEVVSNPEFLREGSAINDTLHPDRIVIGARSHSVAMPLLELYAPLERPMLITDVYSAEIIKYASNAFLAMRLSFINAIADLCERVGADIGQVVKGLGYDPRIGAEFLQPGLGYGGSCLPKDTESLLRTAHEHDYDFSLLRAVIEINRERAPRFVRRMEQALADLAGRTVGVLGLAFKPNTDDLREAKAIELIGLLLERGARVKAYDPAVTAAAPPLPPAVELCDSAYAAAEGCDALVIATEWNEFKLLNLERLKSLMKAPVIFDGRNIYTPERMRRLGFEYHSVGRVALKPQSVTGETR